jgi:hypothetical protein
MKGLGSVDSRIREQIVDQVNDLDSGQILGVIQLDGEIGCRCVVIFSRVESDFLPWNNRAVRMLVGLKHICKTQCKANQNIGTCPNIGRNNRREASAFPQSQYCSHQ